MCAAKVGSAFQAYSHSILPSPPCDSRWLLVPYPVHRIKTQSCPSLSTGHEGDYPHLPNPTPPSQSSFLWPFRLVCG